MSKNTASASEVVRRFLEVEDSVARLTVSVAGLKDRTQDLRHTIANLDERAAQLPRLTLWQRLTRWRFI